MKLDNIIMVHTITVTTKGFQNTVLLLTSLLLFTVEMVAAYDKSSCPVGNCLLPPSYDNTMRPNAGKPLKIMLQLYIESFGKVDVSKMEMEAFGYLIQRWTDPRLSNVTNSLVTLDGHDSNMIWLPDVYCVNCRKSNLEAGRNKYQNMVRISSNGSVYFSTGIDLVSSCLMNLRNFPFDTQQCELHLSSYAYPVEEIQYTWYNDITVKSLSMDQFDVIDKSSRMKYEDYASGRFQIAIATFKFERRVGFYFLQLYIPTAMLVCLSWAMFLMDSSHSGDRIAIGVTLFLTMIFLHGYANTSLPKVSYIKSLDVYMVVSLTAILVTIFESVLTIKLNAIEQRKQKKGSQTKTLPSNLETCNKVQKENSVPLLKQNSEVKLGLLCLCQRTKDALSESETAGKTCKSCICENESSCSDTAENGKKIVLGKEKETSELNRKVERYSAIILPFSFILFNFWYYFKFAHDRHRHGHT